MRDDENLSHLVAFAGGLSPKASDSAEVVRVSQETKSFSMLSLDFSDQEDIDSSIQNGDTVRVYPVGSSMRNAILVSGHAKKSGFFPWSKGLRLSDIFSSSEDKSAPLRYYEAILFQFVNPKAWVICITAVTLFYPEDTNILVGTLFMVLMSTIINIPSISIWAYGGSIIRNYLSNIIIKKILEWLLAALLLITAFNIVFPKIMINYFFSPFILEPITYICSVIFNYLL